MTVAADPIGAVPARVRPIRLGVVSFINALPLIDGLERLADVTLTYSVPSRLFDQLLAGEVDAALCSSIDYQRSPQPLAILPVGLLGCDGPTLTVRLYSSRPFSELSAVACDTDSHTSIALLQVLLGELYGVRPKLTAYDASAHSEGNGAIEWPQALLLIGDKVVTDAPPAERYPHQLDLGAAWVERTGLPFVFALWLVRSDADPAMLATAAAVLDRQRRHNLERIDRMIHLRAKPRGWAGDVAQQYLTKRIAYEFTPERLAGLELFLEKSAEHGLIGTRRALRIVGAVPAVV